MISKNNLGQRFQSVMDELSSKMSENKLAAKDKIGDFIESGLPPVQSEMVIATLNGAIGDYLAQRNSRFLQPMLLRDQHQTLNLEPGQLGQQLTRCTERIVVCVHGWCMNDVQWKRKEHDHGRSLSQYGYTPVYLRYNTGLHISENGENFARLLEALVTSWPCRVKELVIIGHSMGGLVTRSACYYAEQHQLSWLKMLHTFITLGSPHNGAPLAKLACWIDDRIAETPYLKMLTRLSEIRSSGTKDLSRGHIRHTDWQTPPESALSYVRPHLPQGVACYAIASCLGQNLDDEKNLRLGDGLVPVASALGAAGDNHAALNYPSQHQWVAGGINHIDLLIHPHIANKVQQWVLFNTAQ